jgi:hypothetical protein
MCMSKIPNVSKSGGYLWSHLLQRMHKSVGICNTSFNLVFIFEVFNVFFLIYQKPCNDSVYIHTAWENVWQNFGTVAKESLHD